MKKINRTCYLYFVNLEYFMSYININDIFNSVFSKKLIRLASYQY